MRVRVQGDAIFKNEAMFDILIVNLDHGKAHRASTATKRCHLAEMGVENHQVIPVATEAEFKDELTELKNMGATTCDLCFPPASRAGGDARPRPAKK